MKKIFSLCNQKGGVGKTTTSVNLAAGLAVAGRKILLIDIDPQGNATSGLGFDKSKQQKTVYEVLIGSVKASEAIISSSVTNLDIIPSNAHLTGAELELSGADKREFLLQQACSGLKDSYDFILLDCPPSLGLLTLNALAMSDGIVIPLQCEYYALEGLGQLLGTYQLVSEKLNPRLEISGVLLTMADFRTNLTQQVIDDVRSHFHERVFQTVIPRSVKISEAPSFGKPVVLYDPHCKGATAYLGAVTEFVSRFGEGAVSTREADDEAPAEASKEQRS